jgi:AraC-like DNA-binding protein
MAKKLPVYDIRDFENTQKNHDFYANGLKPHVASHAFTKLPHKHDFFLVMMVTKGSGWHEIDFIRHKVKPGSIFLMQPGQMHYWELSKDIEGYIFFHSKTFYDEGYTLTGVQDFPFYKSFQSDPVLFLGEKKMNSLTYFFNEIISEYRGSGSQRLQKIHALINIIYVELSRTYTGKEAIGKRTYLDKLHEFETLIEQNFKDLKNAGKYARLLNISEKHLNRIVKETVGKTSTQLIADRIVLETKRMLIQGKLTVTEIGYELGFNDKSYFVRFFKKQTGDTPLSFLGKYKRNSL